MSAIGRIFVILNLILAAAFLGWASTSLARGNSFKADLEKERADHQATKQQLDAEISKLNVDLAAEKSAKQQYLEERDNLQADADRFKAERDAQLARMDAINGDVETIRETLNDYKAMMASLEQAKDAAVAEARDLERQRDAAKTESQQALVKARDAEEAQASAQGRIADLERELTSTRKQLSQLDAQVAVAKAQGFTFGAGTKPIDGRVLQVDTTVKPGLVALNVGENDGVTRGTVFQIYNGNVWKGQVRVESVQASMSSALILNLKDGATISQGDSAATIL